MKKKRDLFFEVNVTGQSNNEKGPIYIDCEKIKCIVNDRIRSAYQERKINVMKSKKKVGLIAVAAVLAIGITAFATSRIVSTWYSSSSSIPEYNSLPSAEQCVEDIGYVPVLIDSFSNGYAFDNGSLVNNNLADESGNSIEKFKSVFFRYEKDGDVVNFSQDKFNSTLERNGNIVATVDGIDVYYNSFVNKFVPPSYVLTEEDKKAEENGELVFSYGSSKVEINKVQSVSWVKDGILYELMQVDGKLSEADLTEMAEEVINK